MSSGYARYFERDLWGGWRGFFEKWAILGHYGPWRAQGPSRARGAGGRGPGWGRPAARPLGEGGADEGRGTAPTSPRRLPKAVEGSQALVGAMVMVAWRPGPGAGGDEGRGPSLWVPGAGDSSSLRSVGMTEKGASAVWNDRKGASALPPRHPEGCRRQSRGLKRSLGRWLWSLGGPGREPGRMMGGGHRYGCRALEIPPAQAPFGMTEKGAGAVWNDGNGGERPAPTSPRRLPKAVEGSQALVGAMVMVAWRPGPRAGEDDGRGPSLWVPGAGDSSSLRSVGMTSGG